MLSIIFGVGAIVVLAFVLFGNLMFNVGGGAFITNVAMACFGQFRGGPAKMAVVGSTLFGTISGVAVANVVTTGVVTIPLMKRIGYKPHVAGAIEAVASSGGQLCPPVMGVTAFIMAELLGVPYRDVAIAATIPALLYYAAVFFQVDMEAGKTGLKGLPREELPKVSSVMGKSYLFLLPFSALVIALFFLYLTPEKSALAGVLPILIIGLLIQKETRFRLGWILDALNQTGRAILLIGPIGALAGIVVGTMSYTGIGFLISLYLGEFAGGNLFLLLPIVAIACFVLGMGMPTLPAYILLAVLIAPVMVQLGVVPMAAHMFILYYAGLSMITPPVCLAAYAGAAIAGADPMRTGVVASRLGIISYIIPFLFIFFPALALHRFLGTDSGCHGNGSFRMFCAERGLDRVLVQDSRPDKEDCFGTGRDQPLDSHSKPHRYHRSYRQHRGCWSFLVDYHERLVWKKTGLESGLDLTARKVQSDVNLNARGGMV